VSGLDANTAAGRLRRWALGAVGRHTRDGTLPTSIRHLFYEAVMQGAVPKHAGGARRSDQNLADAVLWLRENGLVPWDAVEDRTRHLTDRRGHGATVADGVDAVLAGIRIDPWDDVIPILVAESESVAGVLDTITYEYRTVVVPTRGQANGWLRTVVAHRLRGRSVVIGYLGDADKAGDDIEANSRRVLDEVLAIKHWERLALTWEQVEDLGLPTVARTDRRDGRTRLACEVEAYPQRRLVDDVALWLLGWLPVDLDYVRVREEAEQDEVRRLLGLGGVGR
jgi:hypothetical protein